MTKKFKLNTIFAVMALFLFYNCSPELETIENNKQTDKIEKKMINFEEFKKTSAYENLSNDIKMKFKSPQKFYQKNTQKTNSYSIDTTSILLTTNGEQESFALNVINPDLEVNEFANFVVIPEATKNETFIYEYQKGSNNQLNDITKYTSNYTYISKTKVLPNVSPTSTYGRWVMIETQCTCEDHHWFGQPCTCGTKANQYLAWLNDDDSSGEVSGTLWVSLTGGSNTSNGSNFTNNPNTPPVTTGTLNYNLTTTLLNNLPIPPTNNTNANNGNTTGTPESTTNQYNYANTVVGVNFPESIDSGTTPCSDLKNKSSNLAFKSKIQELDNDAQNSVLETGYVTYSDYPSYPKKCLGGFDSNGDSYIDLIWDTSRAQTITGFIHCHQNNEVHKNLAVFSPADMEAFGTLIENSTADVSEFTCIVTSEKGTFAIKITDKQAYINFANYLKNNQKEVNDYYDFEISHTYTPEKQLKKLLSFIQKNSLGGIEIYQKTSSNEWEKKYLEQNKLKTKKC